MGFVYTRTQKGELDRNVIWRLACGQKNLEWNQGILYSLAETKFQRQIKG